MNPSSVDLVGAGRPSQNRWNVLDELDPTVEGPAASRRQEGGLRSAQSAAGLTGDDVPGAISKLVDAAEAD